MSGKDGERREDGVMWEDWVRREYDKRGEDTVRE